MPEWWKGGVTKGKMQDNRQEMGQETMKVMPWEVRIVRRKDSTPSIAQ